MVSRSAGGMVLSEAISYALISAVAIVSEPALLLAGIFFFAVGSGLLEPPLNGLISAAAGPSEQGIVQGGQQALRALAGVLYMQLGGETPYWLGALLLLLGNHHSARRAADRAEPRDPGAEPGQRLKKKRKTTNKAVAGSAQKGYLAAMIEPRKSFGSAWKWNSARLICEV